MIFRNGNPFRSELPNDHDVVLDGTIEFKGGVDGTARVFEDGDVIFERRIDQLGEASGFFLDLIDDGLEESGAEIRLSRGRDDDTGSTSPVEIRIRDDCGSVVGTVFGDDLGDIALWRRFEDLLDDASGDE